MQNRFNIDDAVKANQVKVFINKQCKVSVSSRDREARIPVRGVRFKSQDESVGKGKARNEDLR